MCLCEVYNRAAKFFCKSVVVLLFSIRHLFTLIIERAAHNYGGPSHDLVRLYLWVNSQLVWSPFIWVCHCIWGDRTVVPREVLHPQSVIFSHLHIIYEDLLKKHNATMTLLSGVNWRIVLTYQGAVSLIILCMIYLRSWYPMLISISIGLVTILLIQALGNHT
jgi:hypothetical protein